MTPASVIVGFTWYLLEHYIAPSEARITRNIGIISRPSIYGHQLYLANSSLIYNFAGGLYNVGFSHSKYQPSAMSDCLWQFAVGEAAWLSRRGGGVVTSRTTMTTADVRPTAASMIYYASISFSAPSLSSPCLLHSRSFIKDTMLQRIMPCR